MKDTRSSGMYPVWHQTASDFAYRLDKIGSGRAKFMAKKMREFAKAFAAWEKGEVPSGPVKGKIIGDYMTCYRDALDIFAQEVK